MVLSTPEYFAGFGLLALFDGLWLNFVVPRLYNSIESKSSPALSRIIKGNNLSKDGAQLSETLTYYELPTVENRVLRAVIFFANCSIPPALVSYAINRGLDGGDVGAMLGFYAYFVFNAVSVTISSWSMRDAAFDTAYGLISVFIMGTLLESLK